MRAMIVWGLSLVLLQISYLFAMPQDNYKKLLLSENGVQFRLKSIYNKSECMVNPIDTNKKASHFFGSLFDGTFLVCGYYESKTLACYSYDRENDAWKNRFEESNGKNGVVALKSCGGSSKSKSLLVARTTENSDGVRSIDFLKIENEKFSPLKDFEIPNYSGNDFSLVTIGVDKCLFMENSNLVHFYIDANSLTSDLAPNFFPEISNSSYAFNSHAGKFVAKNGKELMVIEVKKAVSLYGDNTSFIIYDVETQNVTENKVFESNIFFPGASQFIQLKRTFGLFVAHQEGSTFYVFNGEKKQFERLQVQDNLKPSELSKYQIANGVPDELFYCHSISEKGIQQNPSKILLVLFIIGFGLNVLNFP